MRKFPVYRNQFSLQISDFKFPKAYEVNEMHKISEEGCDNPAEERSA